MKFVKDLDETFRLLAQCCGGSVYTSIGTDAEGVEIAVPMFTVGKPQDEERREIS